ncbi:MAG: hypothetical protein ACKVS7_03695 [Gemmatimonadaceae bacterium]
MSLRRLLLPIASILLATTACSDGSTSVASEAEAPRILQFTPPADLQFEAAGASVQSSGRVGRTAYATGDGAAALLGPSVDKYYVSFWSKQGTTRSVQINYVSNGKTSPYLKFTASDPEWAPNVGEMEEGDSILITMIVDPTVVGAVFSPAGLEFDTPSTLQIWYGGVSGDLNGDRKVDSADTEIEKKLLGMSYRENWFTPWVKIPYTKNTTENWLKSNIYHFSEYAVSW